MKVDKSTDTLITELKKQAGVGKTLPADLIIELGIKARKDRNYKLLGFLKTITPLKESSIKKNDLSNLIREIVTRIVKEIDPKPTHLHNPQVGIYPANFREVPNYIRIKKNPDTYEFMVVWFVNGKRDDNKTYYTNDLADVYSTFKQMQRHVDAANAVKEQSMAAAAGPVTTPMAFKKKPTEGLEPLGGMEEEESYYKDAKDREDMAAQVRRELELIYKAGLHQEYEQLMNGIFDNGIKEFDRRTIELAKLKKKAEQAVGKSITEMTTTDGGTPGYNIPGAFSGRGGSKKGVAGSAALGYELTPQGKKDMQVKADKLYESKNKKR